MQSTYSDNDLIVPYEEEINGFTIYIEDNPDRWYGGYSWAVCKDEIELDSGLEFSTADALQAACAQTRPS